jgi:hypothetical protein
MYSRIFLPGVMVQSCNPSYWEAEIRRIMAQGQPKKKFMRPPSQPMTGHNGLYLSSQKLGEAQIGSQYSRLAWA